ncbi:MAG: DUF72 domain-containing protein [Thermoplasmatales archaeon]|nr:DUF72 domain-containing protein [Thermoplasmatales archaeon]
MIKVGCCGFPCRKEEYFKRFEVLELQKTFYSLPEIDTAKKWRKEKPENFEYTMKAWQLITHLPTSPTYRKANLKLESKNYGFFKPTDEIFSAWERCREFAKELDARIVVFQCPPNFHESAENVKNIEQFFSSIKKEFIYSIEFRGKWSKEKIVEICEKFDLIHCVDPFKSSSYYGEIKYYRLHGIGGYNYDYSKEELKKILEICRGEKAYCLFNNTKMLKNASEFKEMIKNL